MCVCVRLGALACESLLANLFLQAFVQECSLGGIFGRGFLLEDASLGSSPENVCTFPSLTPLLVAYTYPPPTPRVGGDKYKPRGGVVRGGLAAGWGVGRWVGCGVQPQVFEKLSKGLQGKLN